MTELFEINNAESLGYALSNPKVLVEFGAEWCAPCKAFLPHFQEFAKRNPDILCVKTDVDKLGMEAVKTFNVMSVPTVLYYEDGALVSNVRARTVISLEKELT